MSEQPSEAEQVAQSFSRMAERVLHNADSVFGGAVVIIPPKNAGDQIELLMLDAQGDAAQFWGTIKTRIDLILSRLDEQQRNALAFRR